MGIYKKGRPVKYTPATNKGKLPPKQPGEYRICNSRGKIVYIGETCNLYRRMKEHIHNGKISMNERRPYYIEYQLADINSSSKSRREHEKKKIAKYRPLLNKSRGGEGRIG